MFVMLDSTSIQIAGFIENLLLLALRVGEKHRFPHRFSGVEDDTSECVGIVLKELDELDCPWAVQNRALSYINDADQSKVWDELHRRPLAEIAREIVAQGPDKEIRVWCGGDLKPATSFDEARHCFLQYVAHGGYTSRVLEKRDGEVFQGGVLLGQFGYNGIFTKAA